MEILSFILYSFLVSPLTILSLHLAYPFFPKNHKIKKIILQRWKEKSKWADLAKLNKFVLVHCASGEIEYAKPLIRKIHESHPELLIALSYSSPSILKLLTDLPPLAWTGMAPWDSLWHCFSFFSKSRPEKIYISRTDAWPLFCWFAKQKKIPCFLFSATFASNTSRLSGPSKFLNRFTLKGLQKIFVVSQADQQNLKANGLNSEIIGDTRYDQVFYRLNMNSKKLPVKDPEILIQQKKCISFGSTWPEDESVILESLINLSEYFIIWAPHEISPMHIEKLVSELKLHGRKVVRFSEWTVQSAGDLLLVDQVGYLAEMYKYSQVAFIGGSFRKQVHSVMEALAAGNWVLVGPYHLNNREALEFKNIKIGSFSLVTCIQNSVELSIKAKQFLALSVEINSHKQSSFKNQIVTLLQNRQGATDRVLEETLK